MKKPRAYVSQLTVHFGNATTVGTLRPIRKPESHTQPQYALCTPNGEPVEQVYRDKDGQVWTKDQLARYDKKKAEDDGEVQIISQDTINEAKASSLPLNVINLTAHPKEDVEQYVFPSTNQAYIFEPVVKKGTKEINDPVNTQWYDFMNVILQDGDIALVGMCNLQNHEGLFRLGLYQGWITLQKQLYPEELNQYNHYTVGLNSMVKDKAIDVSRKTIRVFDAEQYVNLVAQRLADIDVTRSNVSGTPITPVPTELDMMEALETFGV